MKVENHIKRILGREGLSTEGKRMALYGLALRCVPGSPLQNMVWETMQGLKAGGINLDDLIPTERKVS